MYLFVGVPLLERFIGCKLLGQDSMVGDMDLRLSPKNFLNSLSLEEESQQAPK